jgi:hypothetical protein
MTEISVADAPPKNRVSTLIKFFLFLGLGIFIIWLSLRGLTAEERRQILFSFRIANYNWVILTICLGIISHIFRSLRWMLLFEPMGYKPSLKNTFYAVMVGYFANLAFPRLGEVTRCGVLANCEKIPFNKSFGTVITERAVDMICFLLLFLLMVLTQMGTISDYMDTNIYPKLVAKFGNLDYTRMVLLGLLGIATFVMIFYLLIHKRVKKTASYQKLKNLVFGFWEGLKSLVQMKQPWLFVFYSIVIWVFYFFMLYICFFCFSDTGALGLGAGLSSLVLGSIGIMITPGGIGLYPAIIQETLQLYGIVRTTGLALGWIAWVAQTGMIILIGGISLILLSFNKKSHGKINAH